MKTSAIQLKQAIFNQTDQFWRIHNKAPSLIIIHDLTWKEYLANNYGDVSINWQDSIHNPTYGAVRVIRTFDVKEDEIIVL